MHAPLPMEDYRCIRRGNQDAHLARERRKQPMRPSSVLMIIGGIGIVITSFLEWFALDGLAASAWDYGLLGLYQVIIGALVALFGFGTMSARKMDGRILGLSIEQWMIALPFAVFVWSFALQFDDAPKIGVFFSWISAAVAWAGGVISHQGMDRPSDL